MTVKYKSIVHEILDNGLRLKDFFIDNGITEVELSDLNTTQNAFNVKSVDHDNGLEYKTTVSDTFILSCIFQSYSKNQINELVSFLNFYEQLFFVNERSPNTKIDTYKNSLIFDNGWLLIYVSKKDNGKKISIDFNKYSSFFQNINLPYNNFDNLMNSLKNILKKAINTYYQKNNVEVTNESIQWIINESLQDYDYRINSRGLYDIKYFNLIKDNVKKSLSSYKILNQHDVANYSKLLKESKILIIRSQNEDFIDNEIDSTKFGLKFLFTNGNYNEAKVSLNNVFSKENVSYFVSIISLLSFINKINNDFLNDNLIDMFVDKFTYDSKNTVVSHNTILFTQVGNFRFNIGRSIEIYYFNEANYSRQHNGSITIEAIRGQSSFKVVYEKLLKDFIKKLADSQELKPKNLKIDNILLEYIQNY